MGEAAVTALKSLEARGIHLTLFNLRIFENLHTKESKELAILALQHSSHKWADIERSIQEIIHKMWCAWVWQQHPNITEEKRMPLTSSKCNCVP
jgi:hypothetical protein